MPGARLCVAFQRGICTAGSDCIFKHSTDETPKELVTSGETIGSRAARVLQSESLSESGGGEQSESYASEASQQTSTATATRSWADQSEDYWPELSSSSSQRKGGPLSSRRAPWLAGDARPQASALRAASGAPLPDFNTRLDYPEFIPSHAVVQPYQRKSRTAKRRKQREQATKRSGLAVMNQAVSDRVIEDLASHGRIPTPLFVKHRDYPRTESHSPERPQAPFTTPRVKFGSDGMVYWDCPDGDDFNNEGDEPGATKCSL